MLAAWTVVSAVALRAPWGDGVIDDEHRTYAAQSGNLHPVTLEDFRRAPWLAPAALARRDVATRPPDGEGARAPGSSSCP